MSELEFVTHAEYDADKKTTEERFKRDYERLNKIEEDQCSLRDMATSVKLLASEQGRLKTDITEIKTDVKSLTEKPGKRWDGLIDKILFAAAGAVIAWILSGAPGM